MKKGRRKKKKIQQSIGNISSFCDLFPVDIVKYIFSMLNPNSIKAIRMVDKKDNQIATQFIQFFITNISERNIEVLHWFILHSIKPNIQSLIIPINSNNLSIVQKILSFQHLYVVKLTLDFKKNYDDYNLNSICSVFDIKIQTRTLILKNYDFNQKSTIIPPKCIHTLCLTKIMQDFNLKILPGTKIEELYLQNCFLACLSSIPSLKKIYMRDIELKCVLKLIQANTQIQQFTFFGDTLISNSDVISLLKLLPKLEILKFIHESYYDYFFRKWAIDCKYLPPTIRELYVPHACIEGDISHLSNLNEICYSSMELTNYAWVENRQKQGQLCVIEKDSTIERNLYMKRIFLDSF